MEMPPKFNQLTEDEIQRLKNFVASVTEENPQRVEGIQIALSWKANGIVPRNMFPPCCIAKAYDYVLFWGNRYLSEIQENG